MKKVLITGATGLIGRNTIEPLLEAGFDVFGISSNCVQMKRVLLTNPTGLKGTSAIEPKLDFNFGNSQMTSDFLKSERDNRITWLNANLLDFENIINVFQKVKPEYLLHFAWSATPWNNLESNLNFDWVTSSIEMLKQFKQYGGKRAVFAGTCFEYEFGDEILNEFSTKVNPISTYAKCKNYLNELATLYANGNDISFGWGRIFYAYGKHEKEHNFISHVIKNLIGDNEITIKSQESIRDYMHAEDIAEAFVKFLKTDITGNVNICTGIPVKTGDIIDLIAERLDKKHLIKFEDEESNEPKIILGDNKRLSEEINFIPKYSLDSGISKLLTDIIG